VVRGYAPESRCWADTTAKGQRAFFWPVSDDFVRLPSLGPATRPATRKAPARCITVGRLQKPRNCWHRQRSAQPSRAVRARTLAIEVTRPESPAPAPPQPMWVGVPRVRGKRAPGVSVRWSRLQWPALPGLLRRETDLRVERGAGVVPRSPPVLDQAPVERRRVELAVRRAQRTV
jgi:hypothetical protein